MASSFFDQIPTILNIMVQTRPKRLLDIGKGFGKYGFLAHEYIGIADTSKINPEKKMQEQSSIEIDAIEIDSDLLLPHLKDFYRNIFHKNVFDIYKNLNDYDLVLMIDVIEHLEKEESKKLIDHFLSTGADIIIATPLLFFEQHLYQSVYEEHISHWDLSDFKTYNRYLIHQKLGSSRIYFLSKKHKSLTGFGSSFMNRLKRIGRAVLNEL